MGEEQSDQNEERLDEVVGALKRFLGGRDRSSTEVLRKMEEKKLARGDFARRVLERLVQTGIVDDLRFSKNRAYYRMKNGYGPHSIARELSGLVCDPSIVNEAMGEIETESFIEGALGYLKKKSRAAGSSFAGHPEDQEGQKAWKEKMSARLMARGFRVDQIDGAMEKFFEQEGGGT